MSQSGRDRAPSNAELAQRTARIEEQVDHVADTVDRIETRVTDEQDELAEAVEENGEKVGTLWTCYRLGRWAIPVAGTFMGGLAAIGAL